jgi:hypothetical protein
VTSLPSVRDLKRRYKLLLAERRALHVTDLGISLPISTGDPVLDAALLEKLVPTTTMGEAEHLARAWELVRASTPRHHALLRAHARSLLNDHKLLHAIGALERGDEATLDAMLDALPWAWRLGFPTAVIKPAARILTGWRKRVPFRLIDPPFDRLRAIFRATIAAAPDATLLKFRDAVKESAALLRFRFEGPRERAIHDLCFGDGRAATDELPAVGAFVRARDALATGGVSGFVRALDEAPGKVPLTALLGLFGQANVRLDRATLEHRAHLPRLRAHAIASASGVEMLLRLHEWGSWLRDAELQQITTRVHDAMRNPRVSLPFFKVLKGFEAAPLHVRQGLARPLLLPLMERFGRDLRALLPGATDYTFVLPSMMLRMTSLMLYAMVAQAGAARLVILRGRGLADAPPVSPSDLLVPIVEGPHAVKAWLERELGAVAHDAAYTFDVPVLARTLGALDPRQPLLLDVPFVSDARLIEALLPFDLALNLNPPVGAPGELTVGYEFYTQAVYATPRGGWAVLARGGDTAATRFGELVDRLRVMSAMAAEVAP